MKYKSKYGLNSGNTFHFGSRLRMLKGSSVRRENILLKTVRCEKGDDYAIEVFAPSAVDAAEGQLLEGERLSRLEKLAAATVPDGGLPFTSHELYVPNFYVQLKLSLNKHKRWLLPDVITDCISKLRSDELLYLEDCDAAGRGALRRKNVEAEVRTKKRKRRRRRQSDDEGFIEEEEESRERPGVSIRVTLKHRLITFRSAESFHSQLHGGQPCGSRRADCVHYDDSAALPLVKRKNVKSNNSQTASSFATDLRHAMRPLKETDDVAADPDESSDETAATVAAQPILVRRTHTRGVQRMKTGKCKRSKRKLMWWERNTQEKNLLDKTRDIPEVQYEICTARPLTSHRSQNDTSHRERFRWHYRYTHPRKSLKKIGGKLKLHKTTAAQPITSRDLYDYVYRFEHEELFDDSRYDTSVNDEEEEKINPTVNSFDYLWGSLLEAGRFEQRTKAYRKKVQNVFAAVEVTAKNSNRASSCTVRRRGKGEAIYICPDDCTKTETAYATPLYLDAGYGSPVPPLIAPSELEVGDDFVVIESAADGLSGVINKEKADKAFRCSVRRQSIESLSQSARYRECFMESRTIPRRFVLDLTERACCSNDLEINQPCSSPSAPRLFVVVEEAYVGGNCCGGQSAPTSSDANAFSQLRCHVVGDDVNDDVRSLLKSQFHDVQIDDFVEILQALVSSVEANGHESRLPAAPVSSCLQRAKTIPRFRFISSIGQWSVESCDRLHAFNALSPFYPPRTTQSTVDGQRWSLPDSCQVCFRSLLPDQDGCVNGLALSDCCHWFCEDCWQQHLANAISQNRLKLQCPSYQCSNEIDRIALISLLPLPLVDRHWTYSGEAGVDSNPDNWRWCANPRCQLVLHQHSELAAVDQSVVASCRCGSTACFKCGGAPHWPSSCDLTDLYNRMKQQRGDDLRKLPTKAFFVSVKRCPACQYPIEKNGGCDHMTCSRCTKQFCWVCRRDWLTHNNIRCFDSGAQTVSIDHTDNVRLNLRFYENAIAQRLKRVVWEDKQKILDRLTTKCVRLQRIIEVPNVSYENWVSAFGIQPSYLPSPAFGGPDGNIFSILAAAASFYLDLRFAIEYSYVSKMTSSRKERRKHQNQLHLLEVIADNLEQALLSCHGRRTEAKLMTSLLTRIQRGYNCMKSLVRRFDSF